jgi:hypothetical protein
MKATPGYLYFAFVLLVTLLTTFYVDLWRNGNTVSRLLPVKTIVEDGTWCIDKYHETTIDKALINGHYYSEKAPLPAWLVTPVYWLLHKAGIHRLMKQDDLLYLTGSVVIACIPFIIIVLLIYHSLHRLNWNIYKAMAISLLLPFSTFTWIYGGTAFSHVMSGMWMILCYIFIRERKQYVMAGFFAGLCFLTEYPTGLLFFIWPLVLLYQTKNIRYPLLFAAGTLPSIAAQLIYNFVFTGNPLDMLYNHQAIDFYNDPNTFIGFALPIPEAMWKLLFGFYRGWFFHAPVLFLFFAFLIKQTIKTPGKMLTDYLLPLVLASYLLFSSYRVWYGGWCFGPRHLVPLTLLLIYHFARYTDLKGIRLYLFYILVFIGVVYCWMAKSTLLYSINAEYKNPLTELILPALFQGAINENNLLTLIFSVPPFIAALVWITLFLTVIIYFLRKSQRVSLV